MSTIHQTRAMAQKTLHYTSNFEWPRETRTSYMCPNFMDDSIVLTLFNCYCPHEDYYFLSIAIPSIPGTPSHQWPFNDCTIANPY